MVRPPNRFLSVVTGGDNVQRVRDVPAEPERPAADDPREAPRLPDRLHRGTAGEHHRSVAPDYGGYQRLWQVTGWWGGV